MRPSTKFTFIVFGFLYCTHIQAQENLYAFCQDSTRFELDWFDEFETQALDTNLWYSYVPHSYMDSTTGNMRTDDGTEFARLHYNIEESVTNNNFIYLDRNIKISDGICYLLTHQEDAQWYGHKRTYTSATLWSRQPIGGAGMYEMRARFSRAYLFSYAFWMFGNNPDNPNPQSTEIDIFEFFNKKPRSKKFESNLYFWDNFKVNAKAHRESYLDSEKWHTYRCIYDPFSVKLYIDDMVHPVFIFPAWKNAKGKEILYPDCEKLKNGAQRMDYFPKLQDRLSIIVSAGTTRTPRMIKKGQWTNKKSPKEGKMEIDYIRYYKIAEE